MNTKMIRPMVGVPVSVLVAACSGASSSEQDPGIAGNELPGAKEVNPYGVAYPTKNLGQNPRAGGTPGNVVRNFKFLGYPGGGEAVARGLQTMQLADYFDPEMRKNKIIMVSVAGVWCGPCQEETRSTVPIAKELEAKGVVLLQALGDGPIQGKGATKEDLDGWVQRFSVNFNIVLDPDLKNMGPFFERGAIPFNMVVDARSMEILYAGTGATANDKQAEKYLAWVANNPAAKF
jgi:thiol-disulfide isomerase/thioredoxin